MKKNDLLRNISPALNDDNTRDDLFGEDYDEVTQGYGIYMLYIFFFKLLFS
jgi:hypothetical protein